MIDHERDRIVAAFERELARAPLPPDLRLQAVRGAVHNRSELTQPPHQWALAIVAVVLAVAIVATLVLGTRALHPAPAKTGPPPSPRAGASVAYDDARGQMVLFGGSMQGHGMLDETWTWDGQGWTHQHPATSPPGRQAASMAYDAARHRVVLIGGIGNALTGKGQVELGDTWTWDGHSWTQEHPATELPAMDSIPLAYDRVSQLVIAFYVDPQPNGKPHTLAWNGRDWHELHPANEPTASAQGSLVWDGSRLLYIGQPFAPEGGRYFSKTWAWDGRDWQPLNPRINLPAGLPVATFDEAMGRVVALDGDTWTWDGSTWSRQHPIIEPSGEAYLVYSQSLRKVIAWGDRYSSQNGDMWSWDGSNWTLLHAGPPVPIPSGKGWSVQGSMSPSEGESIIRKTVTSVHPVLLPGWLPVGLEAQVLAGADGYSIEYKSDQRDKSILLGIVVPNPPPGIDKTVNRTLTFRGVRASYQVLDSTADLSSRLLIWNEPGTMPDSGIKAPGIPYVLSTVGLTDAEFWQVANSLR
jgi:hypothetical protein